MFLFDYGVVVFWGMTLQEEQRILKILEPYGESKLGKPPYQRRPYIPLCRPLNAVHRYG